MRKTIALLLLCIMVCSAFTACIDSQPGGEDTTPSDVDTTPSDVVTTPEPENYLSLDGYTAVRAAGLEKDAFTAAYNMIKNLGGLLGKDMKLNSDWIATFDPDPTVENDEYEILIGATNRKETKEVFAELGGDADYAIRVVGKKIVIGGKSDSATILAIQRFEELCMSNGAVQIPEDINVVYAPGVVGGAAYTLATEYTAVKPQDGGHYATLALTTFRQELQNITGKEIAIASDKVQNSNVPATGYVSDKKEILLGVTNRSESIDAAKTIGAMDYTISITDTKVIICGGTPLSTLRGIDHFMDAIRSGKITSLEAGSYSHTEIFSELYSYNPLCYDFSSFVPAWSNKYNIPDWMRDFEEKTYAFTQNNLRNMSISHRGEFIYYPENSIEGLVSAIYAGVDAIEIDVSQTKDYVLVLLHDQTLNRTTDFEEKAGKNGLPSSPYVYDWTYEELQQLCLKTNSGAQTEYKIPTLYEAMLVMKDNCFFHLDEKILGMPTPHYLTYRDEVFTMANEIGCKESFLYKIKLSGLEEWLALDPADTDFANYVNKIKTYLKSGKIRTRYWTNGDAVVSSTSSAYETEANWKKLRAEGKTWLWSNNLLPYAQYIADNFSPAQIP